MAEKQALNGAYYGPAIPPTKNHHRPSRSSCGCGCCLLKCLLKIIITVVIVLGLAALIFWLVVRPNKIKFHVTEATLTRFDITNNTQLNYNLALNITVRNPNKKIGVYYDRIEARPRYEDQRFDSKFLTPFYQGHKNTTILTTSFQGQHTIILAGDGLEEFHEESALKVYSIDVTLHLRVRFKIGEVRIGKFKPKIQCDLKLPLNGTSGAFQTTRCDWDY